MQYDAATLKELQAVELGMLLEIDRVCEQLGISYFLDSGSALGAARHQGFIPWDDDIDLGMKRADYERFIEEAPALLPQFYRICTPQNTKGYAPLFAKVMRADTRFATHETEDAGFDQGIFIDIFPYDAISSDARVAQGQRRQCSFNQKLSYLYHSSNLNVPHRGVLGTVERFACKVMHHIVHHLMSPKRIAEGFDAWAKKGTRDPSSKIAVMSYVRTSEMDESIIFPPGRASFEDHDLPVPRRLDDYLTRMYGDWKQLPPEEERRNHAPLELIFADRADSL